MSLSEHALIVMAKQPVAGQTKTRLGPLLSLVQSAALYECFLRDTLDLVRQVGGVRRVLAYTPAGAGDYFQALAPDFDQCVQEGPSLGARLEHALRSWLACGVRRVVIMDSDSPTLPLNYLSAAFEALEEADLTLGPCEDGGYYLIGMKRPAPRLLHEVKMSTPSVTAQTLALAAEEGLTVKLLPAWYDVDDAASLSRLASDLHSLPPEIATHTRSFFARL